MSNVPAAMRMPVIERTILVWNANRSQRFSPNVADDDEPNSSDDDKKRDRHVYEDVVMPIHQTVPKQVEPGIVEC